LRDMAPALGLTLMAARKLAQSVLADGDLDLDHHDDEAAR